MGLATPLDGQSDIGRLASRTIVVVGLSYRSTPIEVREAHAFEGSEIVKALRQLSTHVEEGAILSTCNRTEVYAVVPKQPPEADPIHCFLAEYHGPRARALETYAYRLRGEQAMRHLFRVAASLDSMVLGEFQILGQVKDCLQKALEAGSVGPGLSALFRQAIAVGRRVRNDTYIGSGALSAGVAATALARRVLGDLHGKRVLVIGAGKMGQVVATALAREGAGPFAFCNRTLEKAKDLSRRWGGIALPLEHVVEGLRASDLAVTCIDSPQPIVLQETLGRAMWGRHRRPLVIVDISVPRVVAPEVVQIPGVRLYNVDDLQDIDPIGQAQLQSEVRRAEAIVEEEVGIFSKWWDSLGLVPAIVSLRRLGEHVREKELGKAMAKLSHLSDRDKNVVSALAASIVNKLLHEPTIRLRETSGGAERAQAVRELFGLENGDATCRVSTSGASLVS